MKEIYIKLNDWLNDICVYLEEDNSFLLDDIESIRKLNDAFLRQINYYPLDNKTIQNNLTFEDVYLLAREIIEHIDKSYLVDFDSLIQSGELDFSFDNDYPDSQCTSFYDKNDIAKQQIININRQFNYSDVRILVHEFIHYTNGKKYSVNRHYFTEFLSAYYDFYTIDYLLKKGINEKEIDYFHRIKNAKWHSNVFYQYDIVLLAFVKFGNLDDDTVPLLQQYFLDIKKDIFEKECSTLHKNLRIAYERHKDEINENPKMLGCILSEEFITQNYRYVLGTILAIYAYKYAKFNDIVYLNNHINDYNDKSVYDICLSIGIDPKNEDFKEKLFTAIDEYINDKLQNHKKVV